MNDLEIRSVEIRAIDEEAREVSGIAVPWDSPADIGGMFTERFERGAVQDSEDALLLWRHDEPIGLITRAEDTERGWEITARISKTPRGDEAYALLKDKVIREFSVGFKPIEHREETDPETRHLTITRTHVRVREVSLVPFGAYGKNAPVSQVREADNPTPHEREDSQVTDPNFNADLTEIRSSIEELDRKVASLPTRSEEPAGDVFASVGDLVKRVAAGEDIATRAYTGAVSGDAVLKDAWVGDLTEIIKKRRPVLETFATGTLPSTGMNVEYAELESDSTQVGVQSAEGDDLLFGKVSITTQTAPIKTLGGWTSLSRQTIERANVGILDTSWEALAEKYGQASEAYARSILNGALAATGGDALAEVEADLTDQDGIVAMVLDLAEHYEDEGRSLDGVFVDKATFLSLYGIPATDRILQVSGNPADKVGSITVQTASGSVAGLPFRVLPGAAADTVLAYDRTAIKSLEAGGVPFRLQDENVVNLSKDFSLYGYLASFVQKRAGLVKVVAPEA
ncbi:HK97 family phage prohead protease [Demequina sp. NBRC 110055]|uniref:HK97 family phage prohead protease n=1 Tax=Demequina sp. NBRC 110055 TaxID=1570344 RepID=UPI0009FF789B|nr:HK97 family phage prohead protease [Demequina sp. NBRC 110055]